jgi:N-acetylmuramoyl-L-alanine amidase
MQDNGSSIRSRCRGAVSRRDVLKYAASAPVLLSLPTVPLAGAPAAGATSAITGRLVFLDPGHNGANDASINEQVTNGRGGTKECQTTGTSTDAGYPEHSFNWDVVPGSAQPVGVAGAAGPASCGCSSFLSWS